MAEFDFTLTSRAPLNDLTLEVGASRIVERDDLSLVSIAVPIGGAADLASAVEAGWSLTIPGPGQSTSTGDTRLIWTAPDQFLLMFPYTQPDAEWQVQAKLNGKGYTTDQSDAWVILEVSGPETLPAMERLCPLDLSDHAFPIGSAARTVMEHLGVLVIRTDTDHLLLASASSSARSFGHAIETAYRSVTA